MSIQTFVLLAGGLTLSGFLGLMAFLSWVDREIERVYAQNDYE